MKAPTVKLNRVTPRMPAEHIVTYSVRQPLGTHWRRATCAEAGCKAYQEGWRTEVDEGTPRGRDAALYIREGSGRVFTEARHPVTRMTVFTFAAEQQCFRAADHKVQVGRDPLYVVRDGDWRGNPRGTTPRIHKSADDWLDDFAGNQDRLATLVARG